MFDPETFLTELYVCVDDFCKSQPPPPAQPGPAARLTTSEIVTLAIYAQQPRFASERAFYAHAQRHLRTLFPGLPSRPRFNRVRRAAAGTLTAFALFVGQTLAVGDERTFETLDGTGLSCAIANGAAAAGWRARRTSANAPGSTGTWGCACC
jgi:hypothetical protein